MALEWKVWLFGGLGLILLYIAGKWFITKHFEYDPSKVDTTKPGLLSRMFQRQSEDVVSMKSHQRDEIEAEVDATEGITHAEEALTTHDKQTFITACTDLRKQFVTIQHELTQHSATLTAASTRNIQNLTERTLSARQKKDIDEQQHYISDLLAHLRQRKERVDTSITEIDYILEHIDTCETDEVKQFLISLKARTADILQTSLSDVEKIAALEVVVKRATNAANTQTEYRDERELVLAITAWEEDCVNQGQVSDFSHFTTFLAKHTKEKDIEVAFGKTKDQLMELWQEASLRVDEQLTKAFPE